MFFTEKKPVLRGTQPPIPPDYAEKGRMLAQWGQYAQAYILLSQAVREDTADASVYFNLGLCLLYAGEGEKALWYLDAGLEKLKGSLGRELAADNSIVVALDVVQAGTAGYRQPMHCFEPELFGRQCKDRFLRMIVDACLLVGDKRRIRQIADSLQNKRYANVMEALRIIEPELE